jgi:hypothetical protein
MLSPWFEVLPGDGRGVLRALTDLATKDQPTRNYYYFEERCVDATHCNSVAIDRHVGVVLGPAGRAQADRTPVTDALHSGTPTGPSTLSVCAAFPVIIPVVTNNEFRDATTLADRTTITRITGNLVLSFTNNSPGDKSIFQNVSGPTIEADHAYGTETLCGRVRTGRASVRTARPIRGSPASCSRAAGPHCR